MEHLSQHVASTFHLTTTTFSTASDGFLNNPSTNSQTSSLYRMADHTTRTLRAFDGTWDDSTEQTSKTWCDECLKMIKSSGDITTQRAGATMLAGAITRISANPQNYMEKVYARCADGVVWLLKHCRATSLKGNVDLASLEVATFECCSAMLNALNSPSATIELRKCSTQLLSDLIPQLTSMLSLGTTGINSAASLEHLLHTTTLALVLFEHKMRPYLGPLRGALLRARFFIGAPTNILLMTSRCWSLVVAARCRTQKPKDGNEGNSERNTIGTDATLDVPAHFWEEECMRIVNSTHDLLHDICPAAAKQVDSQEERLEENTLNGGEEHTNQINQTHQTHQTNATTNMDIFVSKTEPALSDRLDILSYLLSSMLSSGPTGPPGRAMLAVVPVVAIVDVLERLILCALNCQVIDDNNNNEDEYSSMSNSIGGLKSNALRSFVPRLYAAFGRIFPALVDGVSLLRYTSRISTTLVRGLKFVSHGRNNVSCPTALISMLQCCNRYSIRQGGALRQNFVEPIIMLCIREIHVRMMSQPTDTALIGAIVDMGGAIGKKNGKRGKKRGRGSNGASHSNSSASSSTASDLPRRGETLSTDTTLPIAPESNASHRRCCLALIRTMESLLQSSSHHIGTVVHRDVRTMLYGLTNHIDVRPTALMECSTNGNAHDGVALRLSVYDLLATCVLLPSASGNISGGSLLGHAMQVYHDGLQDGDWRIVKTCRRSILMLRPILHPQVAPMRTFEPKIAPIAKKYKTTWPTGKREANNGTAMEVVRNGAAAKRIKTTESMNRNMKGNEEEEEEEEEEDNTPIEVEKVILEIVPEITNQKKKQTAAVVSVVAEDDDDEDFPDIVT